MKCTIPEISWHNRDPVLSVDIQPKIGKETSAGDFYRLASGGTDSHVLIWYVKRNLQTDVITLDVAADLTRHQRAVNCVRFSPSGELLASGDDESVIMIWKQKGETETLNILDNTNESDKEIWITMKILRGHMEDIYDLSWSPNSSFLISGSVDNTAMVWDVQKGKSTAILSDHKGFVQGVSWDPQNQYLATLSTDRYFRIFDIKSKKVLSRNSKCVLPVPETSELHGKTVRLYHDDTLQTFFRRLSFSPDGNIIVVPSGVVAEVEGIHKPLNTTYIYTRFSLKQPSVILPSPDQHTVAIRFCPVLFKLREHSEEKKPVIRLPYRMVFAVASKSSVYLYDTQQKLPFALISNIHYTRLTDLTWSSDGAILLVSSTDGFCSIIAFNDGEIGERYLEAEVVNRDIPVEDEKKDQEIKPTPIAFRHKPRSAEELKPTPITIRREPQRPTTTKTPEKIEQPPIISSNEKFESPEKTHKPATPIAIRRQPRQPDSVSIPSPKAAVSSPSSDKFKKATPIAIRRKPRDTNPLKTALTKVETDAVIESAVDAWPKPITDPPSAKMEKESLEEKMDIENTEDMRLVYEDSDHEMEDEKPKEEVKRHENNTPVTPIGKSVISSSGASGSTPKTPRRVDFKTISTPKSKKKLL